MDLHSRKLSFIQEFLRLQNEEIICQLESLLRKKKVEQYEKNLEKMSINQLNNDIDQSLNDSMDDRVIDAKDLNE